MTGSGTTSISDSGSEGSSEDVEDSGSSRCFSGNDVGGIVGCLSTTVGLREVGWRVTTGGRGSSMLLVLEARKLSWRWSGSARVGWRVGTRVGCLLIVVGLRVVCRSIMGFSTSGSVSDSLVGGEAICGSVGRRVGCLEGTGTNTSVSTLVNGRDGGGRTSSSSVNRFVGRFKMLGCRVGALDVTGESESIVGCLESGGVASWNVARLSTSVGRRDTAGSNFVVGRRRDSTGGGGSISSLVSG